MIYLILFYSILFIFAYKLGVESRLVVHPDGGYEIDTDEPTNLPTIVKYGSLVAIGVYALSFWGNAFGGAVMGPTASKIPIGVSGDSVPDPSALLAWADTAIDPDTAAWKALQTDTLLNGESYTDPVSGLLVTIVADDNFPKASSTQRAVHYSEGGATISLPWSSNPRKYTLALLIEDGQTWLVDYERGGVVDNPRDIVPGALGDTDVAFSHVNDEIIYYVTNGRQLNRFNVRGDSLENTGNFPVSTQGNGWLQVSDDDNIIVSKKGGSDSIFVYNVGTNTTNGYVLSGLDEPYLEHNGNFVYLVGAKDGPAPFTAAKIVDVAGDSLISISTATWIFHGAALYTLVGHGDADGTQPTSWMTFNLSTQTEDTLMDTGGVGAVGYHNSGNWQQSNVALNQQYFLASCDGTCGGSSDFPNGMFLVRADGNDTRFVATQYNDWDDNASYFDASHPTISPDGLLIMWTCGRLHGQEPGDTQVCVVDLPAKLEGT